MTPRILLPLLLAAGLALTFPARAAGPVATGETAPDFTLTDQDGRSHSLAAERGKRAVVLVFYRGYW